MADFLNAYSIPVDGGDPTMLTDSDADAIFVAGYFPDEGTTAYTIAYAGVSVLMAFGIASTLVLGNYNLKSESVKVFEKV